jgi:hypothetical protein
MVTRAHPWVRTVLVALGGAGAMIALGQVFALAGGSCSILCRPPIAAVFGAAIGLLIFGSGKRG